MKNIVDGIEYAKGFNPQTDSYELTDTETVKNAVEHVAMILEHIVDPGCLEDDKAFNKTDIAWQTAQIDHSIAELQRIRVFLATA